MLWMAILHLRSSFPMLFYLNLTDCLPHIGIYLRVVKMCFVVIICCPEDPEDFYIRSLSPCHVSFRVKGNTTKK